MRVPLIPERPSLRPPVAGPLLGKQLIVVTPGVGCDVKGVKLLWRALRPLGVRVLAATETHGEVVGDDGRRLQPDLLVIALMPDAWDGFVVAGGSGAETMAEDQQVRALLTQAHAAGRFVGAFGDGALVLARAGVDGVVRDTAEELAPAVLHALQKPRSIAPHASP
jgi:catalase